MIRKVLIADRGAIAVRIVRACRDSGLASVVVYAEQDRDALHVRMADEAFALPGTAPQETYLHIDAILGAARRSGADAVHPGCGPLGISAEFAGAVLDAGLTWIGPEPDVIRRLTDKVAARALAVGAGVPVAPGTSRAIETADEALAFAESHGLPVVVKAVHGSGGRGVRIVRAGDSVREACARTVREATLAFGRGECFVEQYVERARQVEVQVASDARGSVLVVGTRDCTLQRRRQKLVAEAPAPHLAPEQDALLERSALAVVEAAGLVGVATVEFLLAASGSLHFLGASPRLPIQHPVTEITSGVDLVREQFRIADGLPLSLGRRPTPRAHAFAFEIHAEDPGRGFLPSSGAISALRLPGGPGVRIDDGVEAGSAVPEGFGSLLATVIVSGRDRIQAVERARRALGELSISGVATTLPFHRSVLHDDAFVGDGELGVSTSWVETERDATDEPQDEYSDLEPEAQRVSFSVDVDGRRSVISVPLGTGAGTLPEARLGEGR